MPIYTPACSASDGHSFFTVSLTSADGSSSPSLSTNPAQTAFTRRLVLLQSQSGPASLSDVSWTVVSTYPPITSDSSNDDDSSFENDLDQLVGDFTAGTSACQVDSVGNFVWLTSMSAVKTSDNPLTATISNVPKGIQYVVSSSGSGGSWSSISTSGLYGASAYLWDAQVNKVGALFSIAPGVFVHALGSTQTANLTLGLLTAGGNLVQSNQTWQMPNVGSSPKAIFLSNRSLYVLGAGNNLTALPFSQTASDIQTLVNFQQSVNVSQTSTVALNNLPSVCTSSQWTGVFPAVANNNVFLLCSSNGVTASSELLVFNGTVLGAPVALPAAPPAAGNITSFSAVASLSDAPGGNAVVAYSVNGSFFGVDANATGLKFEGGTYSVNSSSINTYIPSTSDSTGKTGGIVGSVITAVVVLAVIFWIRMRRRQKTERIAQIFERHGPVTPNSYNGDPMMGQPSSIQPMPPHPPFAPIQVVPPPSEEEQDQAHIEMIRMQLRPAPPSIASGFDSMVRPHAPASESLDIHELDDYSSQLQHGSPTSTSGLIPQLTSNASGYHDQVADQRHKKEDHPAEHYTDNSESSGSSLSPPPPPYRSAGGGSSIISPSAPPLPPF